MQIQMYKNNKNLKALYEQSFQIQISYYSSFDYRRDFVVNFIWLINCQLILFGSYDQYFHCWHYALITSQVSSLCLLFLYKNFISLHLVTVHNLPLTSLQTSALVSYLNKVDTQMLVTVMLGLLSVLHGSHYLKWLH